MTRGERSVAGFSAMADRNAWKSRWDDVWSEWLRALQRRDQVLSDAGLRFAHRVESVQADAPAGATQQSVLAPAPIAPLSGYVGLTLSRTRLR
jgi:hypothetical protein